VRLSIFWRKSKKLQSDLHIANQSVSQVVTLNQQVVNLQNQLTIAKTTSQQDAQLINQLNTQLKKVELDLQNASTSSSGQLSALQNSNQQLNQQLTNVTQDRDNMTKAISAFSAQIGALLGKNITLGVDNNGAMVVNVNGSPEQLSNVMSANKSSDATLSFFMRAYNALLSSMDDFLSLNDKGQKKTALLSILSNSLWDTNIFCIETQIDALGQQYDDIKISVDGGNNWSTIAQMGDFENRVTALRGQYKADKDPSFADKFAKLVLRALEPNVDLNVLTQSHQEKIAEYVKFFMDN